MAFARTRNKLASFVVFSRQKPDSQAILNVYPKTKVLGFVDFLVRIVKPIAGLPVNMSRVGASGRQISNKGRAFEPNFEPAWQQF